MAIVTSRNLNQISFSYTLSSYAADGQEILNYLIRDMGLEDADSNNDVPALFFQYSENITSQNLQYYLGGGEVLTFDTQFNDQWSEYRNQDFFGDDLDGQFAFELQAVAVFVTLDSIVDIDFERITEVADAQASADLVLASGDFESAATEGFMTGPEFTRGDFSSTGDNWGIGVFNSHLEGLNAQVEVGGGAYLNWTLLHEIGHGLGLRHAHDDIIQDNPRDGDLGLGGQSSLNNERYTVMSYSPATLGDPNTYGHAVTPMALDIAALQSQYGAEVYAATDSFYSLNDAGQRALSLIENDVQIGRAYYAIWDSGGDDTVQYGGQSNAVLINLNDATIDRTQPSETNGLDALANLLESIIGTDYYSQLTSSVQNAMSNAGLFAGGFFSQVLMRDPATNTYSAIDGGFSIARGAIIENAVGGSQDDFLIGNEQDNSLTGNGGDDFLVGGAGNDSLHGDLGVDTAVFSDAFGNYSFSRLQDGTLVVSSEFDGSDTIFDIELLQFSDDTVLVSSINVPQTPQIRIEAKPIYLPYLGIPTYQDHLYLVYVDELGSEFVIRGGPASDNFSDFGNIVMEVSVPISDSDDARAIDQRAERGSTILDFGTRSISEVWDTISQLASSINDATVNYDLLGPNSNSAVAAILQSLGLDVAASLPNVPGLDSFRGWQDFMLDDFERDVTLGGVTSNGDILIGGSLGDTISTGLGEDTLVGSGGVDLLDGGADNDELNGGANDDTIIGGQGIDTAFFAGNFSSYVVSRQEDGSLIVTSELEGRDTLRGIENLQFSDRIVSAATTGSNYSEVLNNQFLAFGANSLFRNDDRSSDAIDITSIFENGIQIGNSIYTELFINNNGNVTFGGGLSTYTPGIIGGSGGENIIAPFWADVDTRTDAAPADDGVFWDFNTERDSLVITWSAVGYFSQHVDLLNSFQLEIMDKGDGNIEIIFRYKDIQWTTGDSSDGVGGLGGAVARSGFEFGDLYFELPAAGDQQAMLALEGSKGNLGVAGVWQFLIQNGLASGFGSIEADSYVGTDAIDSYFGLTGDDTIYGRGGDDSLYGGDDDDTIWGEAGGDTLDAGIGVDKLYGGIGNDTYITDGGDLLFELTDAGIDMVKSSASLTLSNNFENLELTGTSSINGTGNQLSNRIFGNDARNTLDGKTGADRLYGGKGNDVYITDGGDYLVEAADGGQDTVKSSSSITLRDNLEFLFLTGNNNINGSGNSLDNRITGNGFVNTLFGGAGVDTILASGGKDRLIGGTERDNLYGGIDNVTDTFVYFSTRESKTGSLNRDVVYNFRSGIDDISLSAIDANSARAGNQAFYFNGKTAKANSVWYQDIGTDLLVRADFNGDKVADFEIRVASLNTLLASDFIL